MSNTDPEREALLQSIAKLVRDPRGMNVSPVPPGTGAYLTAEKILALLPAEDDGCCCDLCGKPFDSDAACMKCYYAGRATTNEVVTMKCKDGGECGVGGYCDDCPAPKAPARSLPPVPDKGEGLCKKCGQTDHGQTGEYPCSECGLPTLHDAPAERPDAAPILTAEHISEYERLFEANEKRTGQEALIGARAMIRHLIAKLHITLASGRTVCVPAGGAKP